MFKTEAMKKTSLGFVVLALGLIVGAYFYFSGNEYEVRITEAQIKEKIDAKLPLKKTFFLIFQLTLENPRVRLENGTNRVKAGLDALLNLNLNNNPKPLGGTVDISGGIRYSADKGEFFLVDSVIENLQIQGVPEKYQAKINRAIAKTMGEYFEENPIYTLSEANAKQVALRMALKSVVVENREIVATFGL